METALTVRCCDDCSLGRCPYCGCHLVQPKSWREVGEGRLRLKLRCPQCQVQMTGTFDHDAVAHYDEALVEGRRALSDAYEQVLRENLAHEAELLRRALELDLVGADDFAATAR